MGASLARIRFNFWNLALLLTIAYLSVVYHGYRLNDLLIYLPLSLYLREPSLYPGNPLIEHLLGMPYPLYRFYALVYDQRLLFVVYLLVRILLVAALVFLGTRLFRDRLTVWLGLVLLLFAPGGFGTLGATSLFPPDPSQFTVAAPLLILALALALDRRWLAAFGLAGLAFNLHPILGTATLALLGAQLVVVDVWRERSVSLGHALVALALGVACALPVLVITLGGLGAGLAYSSDTYLEIVRFANYFHVFPSTFGANEYLTTALTLAFLLLGLRYGQQQRNRDTVLVWLLVIGGFCLVGTIFSEVVPVAFVLKLMPFRSTLFLKIVGCYYAASYLRARLESDAFADYVLVGITLVGFYVNSALLSPALGLLLLRAHGRSLLGLAGAMLAASFVALAVLDPLLNPAWPGPLRALVFDARRPLGASIPNSVIALTIIVVTLAAARLMRRGEGAPHRGAAPTWIRQFARPLPAGAAAIIFLAAVPVIMVLAPAPLDRRIVISDGSPSNDLEDVASWVRSHTAEDASFITSPDSNMAPFTLLAERNTLGDYKLATQSVWDPDFAFVAYERLSDLGCPGPWRPSCRDNSYDSFDAETFHSLGAKYGACYAITSLPQEGDLVEIYHNGSYHVYSLCDARD